MTPTSKITKTSGQTKLPVVFFGTEDFSALFLEALIEHGYDIKAVVTKPDRPKGRHQQLLPPQAKLIAQTHNIPIFQPQSPSELAAPLNQLGSPTGVLVSYGKIIPKEIIDIFTPGIINVHPSLLPAYRGPSPIEASIVNGDSKTGVSIMQLTEKMDAGPVYSQAELQLNGNETQSSLYEALAELGIKELLNTLPSIINSRLTPNPQDEIKATYTKLLTKNDGVLDWQKPALQLEREIRGYNVWPRSRTRLFGHDVIITKAHTVSGNHGKPGEIDTDNKSFIMIDTSDARLSIDMLQPAGKKEMPVQAFLRGYSE